MANRLIHAAYHEAGHVVLPRVLTLDCGGASIKPDHDSAGHAITNDPWGCLSAWERRGKVRDNFDAVWHARIIAFMAGVEAEIVLLGSTMGGDGYDRYQIELMAEELNCRDWSKLEQRLRVMTRMLLRRHEIRVERVANALLRKTTLNGKQLDRLVGRSVNDVRVNAPFLLEMHRLRRRRVNR
jgi:hypothetical protein